MHEIRKDGLNSQHLVDLTERYRKRDTVLKTCCHSGLANSNGKHKQERETGLSNSKQEEQVANNGLFYFHWKQKENEKYISRSCQIA